jgi:Rrf2 family cysteine metabolism transcriptional repressor
MKLSTRARYALRMMVDVAKNGGDASHVSLGDVSDRTQISRRYLDQLAAGLKQGALVRSRSGKGGGYQLARPPGDISAGQIIEAAIGRINVVECVLRPATCTKSDVCECRWVYQLINQKITQVLDEISLADLANRGSLLNLVGEASPDDGFACPTRANGA